MRGMIYKDFLVQRKQLGYYGVFFLVYTLLAVTGVMPAAIMYTMTVLIGMLAPMASFSYDDLARWNKYAAATPAGRRGIVAAKYVFSLLSVLAAAVLSALLLGETGGLGGRTFLALALVCLGIWAVNRAPEGQRGR